MSSTKQARSGNRTRISEAATAGRRKRASPATPRAPLVGKPVVLDELDPELGAKVVERIAGELDRSHRARQERVRVDAEPKKPTKGGD
jgi:hypothetical protein